MNEDLKEAIENHLLQVGCWVTSAEICERFDVSERQLRQVGSRAGLCSEFAISGDKGFRHVEKATPAEWRRFKHRLRKHAIGELVRTMNLDKRRNQVTRQIRRPAYTYQPDTGQGVLL